MLAFIKRWSDYYVYYYYQLFADNEIKLVLVNNFHKHFVSSNRCYEKYLNTLSSL